MIEILIWHSGGAFDFEYDDRYMESLFASEKRVWVSKEKLVWLERDRTKYGWYSYIMQNQLKVLYND